MYRRFAYSSLTSCKICSLLRELTKAFKVLGVGVGHGDRESGVGFILATKLLIYLKLLTANKKEIYMSHASILKVHCRHSW